MAIQKFSFMALPIASFTLGLDRCFCVMYPLRYKKPSMKPVYLAIIIIFIIDFYDLLYIMIPMFPLCNLEKCIGIQPRSWYIQILYFTCALILCTCVWLLWLFRNRINIHLSKNVKGNSNKIIFKTLIINFIFNFVPHVLASVFLGAFGIMLVSYLGPWSTVMGFIDSFLCALLYRNTYKMNVVSSETSKNIIHHRNFEVTKNKINGKQNNSKIFLFLNNERKFGYLYRKSKDNEYLCSECARKWKNVSAKLVQSPDIAGYNLQLDKNMHICNLILYNPFEGYKAVNTLISRSPLFGQNGGSSSNNGTNGISSGFIPPQKQSNHQISPKIRKTKKNNSNTSPAQNGFGTNGISSGFSSPSSSMAQIPAPPNPSQIITVNNSISYKLINCNRNGLKTKRLLVYISPELHYEYYFSPSENGYFCSKCLLKTHWTKATFCYDSTDGKEYLDLGENRHICEPLKTSNIDYSNNIPVEETIDEEMEFLDQTQEVVNDNNYFENSEIQMSDEIQFNLTQDSHDNCDDDDNTYVDQKVVYSPNYEISNEFAFGSNTPQKLTLFCFQDKNLCYEYFWNDKTKCFYCFSCEKNFKCVVSARLMERIDAPAYILLGSEKHRCTPIIHIPEEQISVAQCPDESRPCSSKSLTPRKNPINSSIKNDIIKQENFIIKNAENGEKLLIIFPINGNYQLCYAYDFHKANCYYCRECKKIDLYNYAWLCQTQSGHENYVMLGVKEHICELLTFSSLQIKSIFDES